MPTKVFLSWSGDLSRQLAEVIRAWLPSVLQFVKPYFTPDDVEKGTRWSAEISKELGNSQIGLLCLTTSNIESPWILFEAGALSKSFEHARVCTVLFGLEPTDLKGPLAQLQATRFCKSEFRKLISTINNAGGGDALEPAILEDVFEMWWSKLEEQVARIMNSEQQSELSSRRTDRDILEEILQLVRVSSRHSWAPLSDLLRSKCYAVWANDCKLHGVNEMESLSAKNLLYRFLIADPPQCHGGKEPGEPEKEPE